MTAIALLGPRKGALPWRCTTSPVNFAHRFSLIVPSHFRSVGIRSDYCHVCHGVCKRSSFQIKRHGFHVLSSWRLCPKLTGSGWTMILRLPGPLLCFNIPVMNPCLITCNYSWEKGFRSASQSLDSSSEKWTLHCFWIGVSILRTQREMTSEMPRRSCRMTTTDPSDTCNRRHLQTPFLHG
jgi:hypothetical protein